jgi:hypothetical protein
MTLGLFGIPAIAVAVAGLVGSTGVTASVEPAPEDVSPGVLGFLVTLAVVLACIPLFRSMTGKIRGVEFRDAQRGADPDEADGVSSPKDPLLGRPQGDVAQEPQGDVAQDLPAEGHDPLVHHPEQDLPPARQ